MSPEDLWDSVDWATDYRFRCEEYTAVTVVGEAVHGDTFSSLSACKPCHWRLYEMHWTRALRQTRRRERY